MAAATIALVWLWVRGAAPAPERIEIATFEVSAGSSSSDIRSRATLTVTGKTRTIRGDSLGRY